MNLIKVNLSDINFDAKNTRIHDKKNIEVIKNSLQKFGQYRPFVVQKKGMIVRVGNGMMKAMQELGWTEGDAVIKDLTDEEATSLSILDNKAAELATWDEKLLAESFAGLDDELRKLSGFNDGEINKLLKVADLLDNDNDDAKPRVDEAAELNKKWKVTPGDLFQIGEHRMLCGDSTKAESFTILLNGDVPEMVFTDPPYNVAFNGRMGKFEVIANDDLSPEDFEKFIQEVSTRINELNVPIKYIWCNWKFYGVLQKHFKFSACIVWAKNCFGMGYGYRHQHEFCLFEGKLKKGINNETDLWEIAKDSKYQHPTQKPIELAQRALRNHDIKNVIDLFLGSGSTMVAAQNLNRRCYGIEISPEYCAVILERMSEAFPGILITKLSAS